MVAQAAHQGKREGQGCEVGVMGRGRPGGGGACSRRGQPTLSQDVSGVVVVGAAV